ncbi:MULTISPECIES: NRAMP family divalent metal transporter [Kitasatospora]|uniref:NRAMP family divalent metal transporter n=1 Tax=Kitasatospora TaxID=2063 RepID=UPI000CBFF04E|nr:NRAMP family divalent metal transporter [Kitasatospora sp. GP30]MDH6142681.1 Mn2+/Fe2+ NRAMP family transporter [Kitasatospora sp. GP30]
MTTDDPGRLPASGAPAGTLDSSAPDGQNRDIIGALGSIPSAETGRTPSRRKRLRMLLAVLGPGLIVMGGGNDAGGVQVYLQMGQNYGMGLLWVLVLLFPILYVNQEMVIRLGAVSGVGHARLIFARFGRFWGTFSVIDLLIINAATVMADFLGLSLALGYFGIPDYLAVPASVVLLSLAIAGGTFRIWERFMVFLVVVNLAALPMAFLVHPSAATTAAGFVPNLPGGVNSTLLLIIIAIVGTTVEPWQLFFQQSSIVDKRITPRWIRYARIDLGAGILIELAAALALLAATAFGLAHTDAFGNFDTIGSTAHALDRYIGHGIGALIALATLDGSLIGANLVGLTTSYTLGDIFPSMRHSLHWKPRQAPLFYGSYAVLLAGCAALVLTAGDAMGTFIDYIEALNGVLLPSAVVFLLLLANDKAVLGPWVNTARQNAVAGLIAWAVTTFSLAPVVTTFYPDLTTHQILLGIAGCTILGLLTAAVLWWRRPRPRPSADRRPAGVDRQQWREQLAERRAAWRTPPLDNLRRPDMSPGRRAGLLTLRGYLIFSVAVLVIRLVQLVSG